MRFKHLVALFFVLSVVAAPAAWFGAYQGTISLQSAKADPPTGNSSAGVYSVSCADTSLNCTGTTFAPILALGSTQPNAQTWSATQTFSLAPILLAGGSSAGNPGGPIIFGSPQASIFIPKATGGWGGSVSSNSANFCLVTNPGSADNTSRCLWASAGGTFFFAGFGAISTSSSNFTTGSASITGGKLLQNATGDFAGHCTMSAGTSCTVALVASYTTPNCTVTVQGTTAIAGACSVSGTTVTVTAASSNSATWDVHVFGDPT